MAACVSGLACSLARCKQTSIAACSLSYLLQSVMALCAPVIALRPRLKVKNFTTFTAGSLEMCLCVYRACNVEFNCCQQQLWSFFVLADGRCSVFFQMDFFLARFRIYTSVNFLFRLCLSRHAQSVSGYDTIVSDYFMQSSRHF